MSNSTSAILTRLRLMFRRPKPLPSDRPILGLEPSEVAHLAALLGTPGWRAYCKALEWVFHSEAEGYLTGLSHDDYLKKIGLLAGLRRAVALPDELVALSTRIDKATHDRTESVRHATAARDSRLVGTSWWGSRVAGS